MKFILNKKPEAEPSRPAKKLVAEAVKKPEFRFLSNEEMQSGVHEVSSAIVRFMLTTLHERYTAPDDKPQVTMADALQVGCGAIALADAEITRMGLSEGLPPEKLQTLRDTLFTTALKTPMQDG